MNIDDHIRLEKNREEQGTGLQCYELKMVSTIIPITHIQDGDLAGVCLGHRPLPFLGQPIGMLEDNATFNMDHKGKDQPHVKREES